MLEIKNIKKSFGNKIVLNKISLRFENGKITSLVGKNGAGKSTTISIITDFIQKDSGSIEKELISAMPDSDNLFTDMTGIEFLHYIIGIKGGKKDNEQLSKLICLLNLDRDLKKKIKEYSFGMKKKLSFIQAYLGDFDTYIFDEPTSGVDAESALVIIELIKKLKDNGKTIFLTGHNMEEIAEVSDYIYVLENGKITEEGSPIEIITQHFSGQYFFDFQDIENFEKARELFSGEFNKEKLRIFIHAKKISEVQDILKRMLDNKITVIGFGKKGTLKEAIFED